MGWWSLFMSGHWSRLSSDCESSDCELVLGQSSKAQSDVDMGQIRTFGKVFPTKSKRDVRILGYAHSSKTGKDEVMVQYLNTKDVEWIDRSDIIFSPSP